jgi:hypothetical protein
MRIFIAWTLFLVAAAASGAELKFDFSEMSAGRMPPGFRSALTGLGQPGEWKVVLDEVPPALPPLSPQARTYTGRAVLGQMAEDRTDEHFPLLIYEGDTFDNFTLTTRFKAVRGAVEQMAGVAFRIQNESNYYVLRASCLGNTFRFYKVVNGTRGNIIGPDVPIPSGVWHELGVECKGNSIRCMLDGKELIPPLQDSSFSRGKIGFWTKSDSVSYFSDTKIVYTPREVPAQKLVRDACQKYPHLLALKIYVPGALTGTTRLIASQDEQGIGQPGGKTEQEVIRSGETYFGKEKGTVSVIMPLRDRNGDTIAAARVVLKSFPGQTEANAIVRAAPIVKAIQSQVHTMEDLSG